MKSWSEKKDTGISRGWLSGMNPGGMCTVAAILGGKTLRLRLMDLGIIPGQEIRIIQNDGWGPVLVGMDGSRIVLGRRMAEKVMVNGGSQGIVASPAAGNHNRRRRKYHADNKRFTGKRPSEGRWVW